MNIAIIPARGGSKRIPRKNIRNFLGKPMISYAIQKAFESKLFGEVVVSTDDEEIAQISRSFGASTPFIRSKALSDDFAGTTPVVADAINRCSQIGMEIEYACCIYPCAPFLEVADLLKTFAMLKSCDANYSYPVSKFSTPIQRSLLMGEEGVMRALYKDHINARTQDLQTTYYDAGQFYWGGLTAWSEQNDILSNGVGLEIPNWRAIDFDGEDDWIRAESIAKYLFIERLKNEL